MELPEPVKMERTIPNKHKLLVVENCMCGYSNRWWYYFFGNVIYASTFTCISRAGMDTRKYSTVVGSALVGNDPEIDPWGGTCHDEDNDLNP